MATCLGKSCSFGLPRVLFVNCCQFMYWSSFPLGFEGRMWDLIVSVPDHCGERGGSVVECRTPEREVRGSRPTAAVLCPWARHFTPRKYWLITQEAMAPSRHDWKIVDWDVKPQHNQPTWSLLIPLLCSTEMFWINIKTARATMLSVCST